MTAINSKQVTNEWGKALEANSFLYEALCERLESRSLDNPEAVLMEIDQLAGLAGCHPGRFADGRIENRALVMAGDVARAERIQLAKIEPGRKDLPRVLHVASEVYPSGGHTRVLAKWIERDNASHHLVALTRQPVPVPDVLLEACRRGGAQIFNLPPEASRMSRARALRTLAGQVDRVILHHHPNDVIVVLAMAVPMAIPVALFNHAHFSFGLGWTVADITINTLPYFRTLTERFRFPRATALLTGVPGNCAFAPYDKKQAKRALSLAPQIPVLLTIGAERYYRPAMGYDFFRTLRKILQACGEVQVLIIGPRQDAEFVPQDLATDRRIRFTGVVNNPISHYQAADICLESFPMPSLGGFIEAVVYGGAFPIPVYGPHENVVRINLPPLSSDGTRPKDEVDYIQAVADRVRRLPESRDAAAKMQAELQHLEPEWPNTLKKLSAEIDGCVHSPGPIPVAACSKTEDDHILAALLPVDLWGELHRRFPYAGALRRNANSVFKHAQSPSQFISRESRYAWAAIQGEVQTRKLRLRAGVKRLLMPK